MPVQWQHILLSIGMTVLAILTYQIIVRPAGNEIITIERRFSNRSNCYRASVYEHSPIGDYKTDDPVEILNMNLAHYFTAIQAAAADGAGIIVLPEDSLINTEKYSRKVLIERILEPMPEPDDEVVTLCHSTKWPAGSLLRRLSCAAIQYRIWIALSFGDKVKCKHADTNCPADGHYLYNTIALYNSIGQIVVKYHKMQLYHEHQYNVPSDCATHSNPIVYYDSPFGRLGFAVCFDALYRDPLYDLVAKHHVESLIYSTYWFNYWPFNVGVQVQQSIALAYNINFLASNVHNPKHGTFGSGIYAGFIGQVVHTNTPDGVSRLLVANIGKHPSLGQICSPKAVIRNIWSHSVQPAEEWHFDPKNFTLRKLTHKQDMIEHCLPDKGMCCSLFYRVKNVQQLNDDNFYLIIGSLMGPALHAQPYQIYQEFCGIASCKDTTCKEYSRTSSTLFTAINLKAKFESKIVFPSVMVNGARLLPKKDWYFYPKQSMSLLPDWSMITLSLIEKPILLATLYGRPYELDKPYKH